MTEEGSSRNRRVVRDVARAWLDRCAAQKVASGRAPSEAKALEFALGAAAAAQALFGDDSVTTQALLWLATMVATRGQAEMARAATAIEGET